MLRWVARWASGRANSGREEDDGEMALMDKATSPNGPPPLPMAAGRCLSPHTGCPSCPRTGQWSSPTCGPIEHHPRPATMLPHAWAGFRWWLRRVGLKQSVGTVVAARASMSDGEREIERERGVNRSRCDITGFLQIFATKVLCGMPCRLWLLTWRVWDLG